MMDNEQCFLLSTERYTHRVGVPNEAINLLKKLLFYIGIDQNRFGQILDFGQGIE